MLVKWNPVGALLNQGSLLDDFFNTDFPLHSRGFDPVIDVKENEKNFLIHAELPGLSKDDFKLTVEDNSLTLEGEKKVEKEEKSDNPYRTERSYGAFKRVFRLTDSVDSKKIAADYTNGILSVTVPKTEKAKPKQIEVKVS
jgi:HSP20 family protein